MKTPTTLENLDLNFDEKSTILPDPTEITSDEIPKLHDIDINTKNLTLEVLNNCSTDGVSSIADETVDSVYNDTKKSSNDSMSDINKHKLTMDALHVLNNENLHNQIELGTNLSNISNSVMTLSTDYYN